jgi:hypothetical protein
MTSDFFSTLSYTHGYWALHHLGQYLMENGRVTGLLYSPFLRSTLYDSRFISKSLASDSYDCSFQSKACDK